MSNLIKYPFVNMQGKDAVVIDNNKDQTFQPLFQSPVELSTISQQETNRVLAQLAEKSGEPVSEEEGESDGSFQAGLSVMNYDKILREKKEEADREADLILARAREDAERISQEAGEQMEAAKKRGYEEGYQEGFHQGMAGAQEEIRHQEEELAEASRRQKEELAQCISDIEVKYVDIVIALLKKLTGVVLEDKEDLILYLVQTAAGELEPSENYRIRVSTDDVYLLEGHKRELISLLGSDISVEFIEEKGLEKGQCIIETDSQMADCGFQTRLDMLIRDLKMLIH